MEERNEDTVGSLMSSTSSFDWRESLDSVKTYFSKQLVTMRELELGVLKKEAMLRKLRDRSQTGFNWASSKIVVGVCAMEKKSKCKPMRAILARLPANEFEIKIFEEKVILEDPIACWPVCDCLIAFYSRGFPQSKVEAYVELRKPFLVNDLEKQRLLWDRRNVYKVCLENEIPVPPHMIVDRDKDPPDEIIEADDYIECNGKRMYKPFVEKPVDADCHDVFIYYPKSSGGGRKELFRKIDNRSSEFYPDRNNVRRQGSYIYEEFLTTEGTDVKVYAVTEEYAHAEARKSPVMDGRVMRDEHNVEVRYPVILTNMEKEICRRVVRAFKQNVCGFDMLRSNGKSYVCDVNGWSFVKRSARYHKDTSMMLARVMRSMLGYPTPPPESDSESDSDDDVRDGSAIQNPAQLNLDTNGAAMSSQSAFSTGSKRKGHHEELRAVIAIIRHGDRTPKQKLKILVTDERFMSLFERFGKTSKKKTEDEMRSISGYDPSGAVSLPSVSRSPSDISELKLKTAKELSEVLRITNEIINELKSGRTLSPDIASSDDEATSDEAAAQIEALTQVRAVLEMHGTFRGINRKIQLRCTKVNEESGVPIEAQLILKWGGVLTPQGRERAEQLGRSFRERMYPGIDGLIRLHSTYRHDLRIYASDEGRVQVTAAAFAKGLLDLEGHLTPILESLVRKDNEINVLLHDASLASSSVAEAKQKLKKLLTEPQSDKSTLPISVRRSLSALEPHGGTIDAMAELHQEIIALAAQLKTHLRQHSRASAHASYLRGSVAAAAFRGLKGRSKMSSAAENSVYVNVSPGSPFSSRLSSLTKMDGISLSTSPSKDVQQHHGTTGEGSVMASLGAVDLDSSEEKIDRGDGAVTLRDMFHLAFARWDKLQADFFRKDSFDISKIPDIYDSAKYDITHNPEILKLQPRHLLRVYELSKHLADAVVPQEYGEVPKDKFEIGIKTCHALLGKIREDLRVAAEEGNTTSLSERMNQYETSTDGGNASLMGDNRSVGEMSGLDDSSLVGSQSEGTQYRLDRKLAKSMGIKNTNRHVRTRLYFTSESHLHAVLNVLRYAHVVSDALPQPNEIALKRLQDISELSYLSHIVIRLYEVTEPDGTKHHTVRMYVSNGVSIKEIVEDPQGGDVRVEVGTEPDTNRQADTTPKALEFDLKPSGFGFSSFKQAPMSPSITAGIKRGITTGGHHHKVLPPADPLISLYSQLPFHGAIKLFDPTLIDLLPSSYARVVANPFPVGTPELRRAFPIQRFHSTGPEAFKPSWTESVEEDEVPPVLEVDLKAV